jgi:hypothetical protein
LLFPASLSNNGDENHDFGPNILLDAPVHESVQVLPSADGLGR